MLCFIKAKPELPTSTFLPFFKGKYGSTFFPAKIRFSKFHVFFFFFFNWRVKVLKFTHIIYVMKTWSEFLNNNVKK